MDIWAYKVEYYNTHPPWIGQHAIAQLTPNFFLEITYSSEPEQREMKWFAREENAQLIPELKPISQLDHSPLTTRTFL